jgi:type IV pilus assembly protein PilX
MHHTKKFKAQVGVALVIVMIFIVILSGVAAFSARRALFGEGVARNQLDVEVATQAAEAALRDAEIDMQITGPGLRTGALCDRGEERSLGVATIGDGPFGADCPRGQCRALAYMPEVVGANASSNTNPAPWWPTSGAYTTKWNNNFSAKPPLSTNCNFNGGVALGTFSGTPKLKGVFRQPEYMIEHMNRGFENYFRVTSRGWGLNPGSEVVLQSYFTIGNSN